MKASTYNNICSFQYYWLFTLRHMHVLCKMQLMAKMKILYSHYAYFLHVLQSISFNYFFRCCNKQWFAFYCSVCAAELNLGIIPLSLPIIDFSPYIALKAANNVQLWPNYTLICSFLIRDFREHWYEIWLGNLTDVKLLFLTGIGKTKPKVFLNPTENNRVLNFYFAVPIDWNKHFYFRLDSTFALASIYLKKSNKIYINLLLSSRQAIQFFALMWAKTANIYFTLR